MIVSKNKKHKLESFINIASTPHGWIIFTCVSYVHEDRIIGECVWEKNILAKVDSTNGPRIGALTKYEQLWWKNRTVSQIRGTKLAAILRIPPSCFVSWKIYFFENQKFLKISTTTKNIHFQKKRKFRNIFEREPVNCVCYHSSLARLFSFANSLSKNNAGTLVVIPHTASMTNFKLHQIKKFDFFFEDWENIFFSQDRENSLAVNIKSLNLTSSSSQYSARMTNGCWGTVLCPETRCVFSKTMFGSL